MSRRSLRLAATVCGTEGGQAGDADSCLSSTASLKDRTARTAKQHRSASKLAFSVSRPSRQVAAGQGSGLQGAACLRPPVLDESLIREQTKVDHFWGLDDDGDLKGGNKAVVQGNGKVAADAAWSNGYTCRACTLLSEHQDTLPTHGATSRVYSRDRSQKRKAASGVFWWLGSGWYQFVTLISWLNVFLLTRCLRNICKFLIVLIPLLLVLGAGLSLRGQDGFLSLLPVFNWTHTLRAQRADDPKDMFTPDTSHLSQPPEGAAEASPWRWMSEVERQVTAVRTVPEP